MSNSLKIIEHEGEIVTTHGVFKESEYKERIAQIEAKENELFAERIQKKAEAPKGECPFSRGLYSTCRQDCALYMGGACSLKAMGGGIETRGRMCPFKAGRCASDCMLYNNGCALNGQKGI